VRMVGGLVVVSLAKVVSGSREVRAAVVPAARTSGSRG
jgi:hypothetical protein